MGWFARHTQLLSPSREEALPECWFDAQAWADVEPVSTGGRGAAWFVAQADNGFVLRHFRRGSLDSRVLTDQYFATGADKSRALREYVLLDRLHCLGLPVPEPVAARYVRRGVFYRADILTVRLENTESLAERLIAGSMPRHQWEALGALISRFHQAGAYHAD